MGGKCGLYVKDPGMTFRAFADQLIAKQHTTAAVSPCMIWDFCRIKALEAGRLD